MAGHHLYLWQGVDQQDQLQQGYQTAACVLQLELDLAANGLDLSWQKRLGHWQQHWPRKISTGDLIRWQQQLAALLNAGLPLLDSLKLTARQGFKPRIQLVLLKLCEQLLAGQTLAASLQACRFFPSSMVELVAIGETCGQLSSLLQQSCRQHELTASLKRQFCQSLIYPLITLATGLVVSLLMLIWVVPKAGNFYQHSQQPLPGLTQGLLALSHQLQVGFAPAIVILLGSMTCLTMAWRHHRCRCNMERILWRLPLIGTLCRLHSQAQLCLVLAITFNAGLSLPQCLIAAQRASSWATVRQSLVILQQQLQQGHSLSQVFNSGAWDELCKQMIAVGDAAGTMGATLKQLQQHYQQALTEHTQLLSKFVEPLLMLLLGGLVGTMVIALYLPLLQLGQTL